MKGLCFTSSAVTMVLMINDNDLDPYVSPNENLQAGSDEPMRVGSTNAADRTLGVDVSTLKSHDFPLENLGFQTSESVRAKTALRLKYEAEAEVIQKRLGNLEAIRSQLGLSQRKMAQLLLVDPSAWTRWTKGGEKAPPHVYRMLQWYLALEEKYPALDANFWVSTVSRVNDDLRVPELESQLIETKTQLDLIETKFESQISKLQTNLDQQLNSFASHLSTTTLEAFRTEMNRKDRETRRYLIWIAASVLASSLVLGVLISVLTA